MLFAARLSAKRQRVAAALDQEILRLCLLRRRLKDLDAEVLLAAVDCLGSADKAAHWLVRPETLLDGTTPLEASALHKEQVIELLTAIDAAGPH